MNTDLLSLNDFPHHAAAAAVRVCVSNTAQYEQMCRAQGLVLSTRCPQHTHGRGFTANCLQGGPGNAQSGAGSASAQKVSVSVLRGCAGVLTEAH